MQTDAVLCVQRNEATRHAAILLRAAMAVISCSTAFASAASEIMRFIRFV